MDEFSTISTSASQEPPKSSSLSVDAPEGKPHHTSIPMPTLEAHLPMAFRPIYQFDACKQDWIAKMPTASPLDASPLQNFNLITWNIDFMQPYTEERYAAAVNFLERFLSQKEEPESSSSTQGDDDIASSTVILLQEIDQRFLEYITAHQFVREFYLTTDISGSTWLNDDNVYGVITIIPKSLSHNVASVFRTNFPGTRLGREALYVDLLLPNTEELTVVLSIPPECNATRDHEEEFASRRTPTRYLRIANVHLESLRGRSDAERIEQLGSTVAFLDAPGVHVGVIAGDMNPIGPDDPGLPTNLGFVDAWVLDVRRRIQEKNREGCLGPGVMITDEEIEDDPLGHTWGYQPPTMFKPRRMDKVLMRGENVEVLGIEKIAEKLEVEVCDDGEMETVWVTDHCGLLARLRVR
ncbi:hypothetical protein BJ165DRAFT_1531581 [Panaeolus papilionaceus]|nr:hypothetical protein BJ165DRAFT_1531581 [Panaeolus papilionaceus]